MFRRQLGRAGGGFGRDDAGGGPDGVGRGRGGLGLGGLGRGARATCAPGCADPDECRFCGTLRDAPIGTVCRILRLKGGGAIRRRLLDLGLRPDREVIVLRSAPLYDPIELRVGDSFIVLRRREAAQIDIEHV
ncbi:FeoA family protein [Phaeovulum vinaykumarii]|uniref:Fe2+ transport system protein FeoA n=1 Tax=Phaeovulum vinaykumarii TaxID=407234 RepID=A0A1N7MNN9_9RHOB|nr:FeoA family protein [Phaeovulum vinaykumarii]SIS87776.1 Fe2+ transport system protein FeoA [Phaeovulum vinaykumarii]SOC12949.1 Fe2+ transport system protein FeoA [Phaeovulum vinaykumarii]